ncbi:MAG: hypothetical protein Q6352_016785 [Candidatus Freyrarchaeum guaymaensis]
MINVKIEEIRYVLTSPKLIISGCSTELSGFSASWSILRKHFSEWPKPLPHRGLHS